MIRLASIAAGLALAALSSLTGAQTFTATPSSCPAGQATCAPQLRWSIPSNGGCVASGGWSGSKSGSGIEDIPAFTPPRTFTLTCQQAARGSATLSWGAPTHNTDGSILTNLAFFRVYWGKAQGSYPDSQTVDTPIARSLTVDGLGDGQWFFVITAGTADNEESAYSNVATKTITGALPGPITSSVTVTIVDAPAPPAVATDLTSGGTFTSSMLDTRLYAVGAAVPLATPPIAGATRYEWEVEHQQTHTKQTFSTIAPTVTWPIPKAGHFVARVRPCNAAGCAPWLASSDRGYWFHAWVAAPGF